MKKLLLSMATIFTVSISIGQIVNVNVSTGLGNVGSIDTWKSGISIPVTGNSYVIANNFPGIWEATPTPIINAKWVSVSTIAKGSGQTDFIYERKFNVPSNKKQLKCDFKIAADDVLKKVELIQPNSSIVNLSFTNTANYKFTKPITDSISCPGNGEWTLRVTIFCGDQKGTQGYTGLLVSGNINLLEGTCQPPVCHCPKGWLSNTNVQDGGVTTDGRCKKLVCSPIGVIPPPNGTSVGNWGFTWGNELWAWGTTENGGAVIDCDVTNLAIIKQKDEAVGIGPNLNPLALCPMGFEWKNGSCNPMPSRIYCNDGKKVIMIRVQGQLINTIYTSEPCDETTWPGQGVDGDGTVVRDAGVIGRELTQSMAVADKNLLNMAEISQLYTDQLPARTKFNMAYIQKQSDMISLVLIYRNEKQDLVVFNQLTIENGYLKIAGIPQLLAFDDNRLLVKKIKSVAGSSRKRDYVGHVTLVCKNCGYDDGRK